MDRKRSKNGPILGSFQNWVLFRKLKVCKGSSKMEIHPLEICLAGNFAQLE